MRSEDKKTFLLGQWSTPEIKYLKDNDWVWTEKVDGTNIRVIWNGTDVVFAGRSDEAQIPTHLLMRLQELFSRLEPRQTFKELFGDKEVVLYGEGYGHKIGKAGKFYLGSNVDFVLFDVVVDGYYLERHNIEDVAKQLGIKVVPIIGHGTLPEAIEKVKKGFKSQWGDFQAEGIVARPRVEMFTRKGERVITKVKHRDFRNVA